MQHNALNAPVRVPILSTESGEAFAHAWVYPESDTDRMRKAKLQAAQVQVIDASQDASTQHGSDAPNKADRED